MPRSALVLAALALLLPLRAEAQLQAPVLGASPPPPSGAAVSWHAEAEADSACAGCSLGLTFRLEIEEGWKVYAMDSPAGRPLSVAFQAPAGLDLEGVWQSTPASGYDPNFETDVRYFERTAALETTWRVAPDARPGRHDVEGALTYMACNDLVCLPARTIPLATSVVVGGPQAPVASPPARSPTTDRGGGVGAEEPAAKEGEASETEAAPAPAERVFTPEEAAGGVAAEELPAAPTERGASAPRAPPAAGLWAFLLLAAAAGLGAVLMPCVFPMIPLTVSYFGQQGGGRARAFGLAATFGITLVVAFTALGVGLTAAIGASGAQRFGTAPAVNLLIGGMLVVFGLSLLGAFELRLPARLVNATHRQGERRRGVLGAAFVALAFVLVSFSCTAPFVGGLLAAAAGGGGWTRPVLGMAVFSATFAAPFVALAAFPGLLHRLPTAGGWMDSLKVTFGLVELAAALKFLSNADLVWGVGLLTRPVVVALAAALAVVAGLYALGLVRLGHAPPPERVGALRMIGATGALGLAFVLLPAVHGGPAGFLDPYLPPPDAYSVGSPSSEGAGPAGLQWHTDDLDAAFSEAARQERPVFVDFTGYTCTNCRAMESRVFPDPAVAPLLRDGFVRVRLYTDGRPHGPAFQRVQQEMTGTVAMPTYAVVTPDGTLLRMHSGMASPEAFSRFLRDAHLAFEGEHAAS